jgi:hypothetical protein
VNVAPGFGVLAVLYIVVMAVLIGLAIYVLVLVITFLRLRIAELKRAAPPKNNPWAPITAVRHPHPSPLSWLLPSSSRSFTEYGK